MIKKQKIGTIIRYSFKAYLKWIYGLLTFFLVFISLFFLTIFPPIGFLFGCVCVISIAQFFTVFYFVEFDNEKISQGNIFGIRGELYWAKIIDLKMISPNHIGLIDTSGRIKIKLLGSFHLEEIYKTLYSKRGDLFKLHDGKKMVLYRSNPLLVIVSISIFIYSIYLNGFFPVSFLSFISFLSSISFILFRESILLSSKAISIDNNMKKVSIKSANIESINIINMSNKIVKISYLQNGKHKTKVIKQDLGRYNFASFFIQKFWEMYSVDQSTGEEEL